MSRRARLLVAAGWVVVAAALIAWAYVEGLGPGEAATRLVDAIRDSAWGPLVYLVVSLARPLILFPATVLTVAGGFLFGVAGGLALVLVASNGSALLAYALARWVGGGPPGASAGDGRLARWTRRLRRRSFETVVVMRLLFLPYDLVSYLAGAVRIHLGAFVAGTAIGSAPATVAFVLVGASLESFDGGVPAIDAPVLIASGALLVACLGLAQVLRRREDARDAPD